MHDPISRHNFHEVHDLTAHLRGIVADAVPLRHGPYSGTLSTIDLGDVTLQVMRSAPMLVLGASEEATTGLIQVLKGSDQVRWNGRPIDATSIAVCSHDRPYEARLADDFTCTLLGVRTGAVSVMGLPADLPSVYSEPNRDMRAEPRLYSALATMAQAIEKPTSQEASLLGHTEARRSLRASLLNIVADLLAPVGPMAKRSGRDGRARQRIIHMADEYLGANPARPVYTDDLCAALGASATHLYHAFYETFGISPHRYLKMRRMALVRAALLSPVGPWHSVKAAALSYGFWHLGQFAHDYRAIYGERPSETLARALPAEP